MFLEKYMIIEWCYGCRHVRVPLAAGLAGASQAGRRFDFTGHAGLSELQGGSLGMRKRVSDIRLRHNVDTALM